MGAIELSLIIILSVVTLAAIIALIFVLAKKPQGQNKDLSKEIREEISLQLKNTREEINNVLGNRIDSFSRTNEQKLEAIRATVEDKLLLIQKGNEEKLEKMRLTVDEKLQDTLEKRLGESFKLVSDKLENVYKGLGEMQTLAIGVGDLKKVLTNVKARGSWGEVYLGNILEQFLTPEQYSKNVKIKRRSKDFVEFAIKIPSKVEGQIVMMPIDSKFPIEDYQRLVDAEEEGNILEIKNSRKELEKSVKKYAMDIRDKYIDPPFTTDFGVMFLPTESLYCEVLKNTSLCETLQRDYRVTVTGPTTLTALINSLQLGFKALAIEKQTSEVWKILGSVKTEFSKFGDLLSKTNKKLQEVANNMQLAESKTRNIQSKLNRVEALPTSKETPLFPEVILPDDEDGEELDSNE